MSEAGRGALVLPRALLSAMTKGQNATLNVPLPLEKIGL